jgi:hypothetical protein
MLRFNVIKKEALKNFYLKEYSECVIREAKLINKDYFTVEFWEWITKFEVSGTDLNYQLELDAMVYILVTYGDLLVTVFFADEKYFKGVNLDEIIGQQVRIEYNNLELIQVW